MLNFVKCLFCVYCDDDVIFIFPFVSMLYYVDWFMDIEPFLHSQNKSYMIMLYDPLYDPLYILLNLVANILLRIFAPILIRGIDL